MKAGQTQTEIAHILGRHKSTISREVARGSGRRGYRPRLSQKFSLPESTSFKLLLLGKDGEIKLSTNRVELKDVFSLIDTMPMRKREMQSEKC